MATILYGKAVAEAMKERLAADAAALTAGGVTPTLAIVRVGAREDDIAYERGAEKRCEILGVAVQKFLLAEDAAQAELLCVIEKINADSGIHGCLLFRPLPAQFDEDAVRGALAPEKDVDGITDGSLAGVFSGSGRGYPPCTAQACIELLAHYGIDVSGRDAVVVGRSLVIGKPVAQMLLARNATVTTCHSRTRDLAEKCRRADVLVVAAGQRGLVDAESIEPGVVVVDVGINVDAAGGICGDVRPEALEGAAAYTPVPGGVGAVTTSVLAAHVIDAAQKSASYEKGRL
ncbi:MAG: bifunctional 5,10-methylenetetrahydrofolate dehydrogenase/5,10-methenyltetrahydrofolate cyclohydrolase [Clostridiales Family XIII bacterium]|jgi:methylenetetrahydrofolate dehydrogenase (NADP+)/methenyltetrahydrofolate cyclohydrolase|nr:bifunctional 5,10-methylenetetrahydrofolate dehydrogenase/5,10-methenyltetrahydrofolate cyclohydrolase [Clostridiales Family XIII bacterium]